MNRAYIVTLTKGNKTVIRWPHAVNLAAATKAAMLLLSVDRKFRGYDVTIWEAKKFIQA